MGRDKPHILYLILDGFPTFRPDISALWGRYLPAEGVTSDLSTIALEPPEQAKPWGGGKVMAFSPPANKIKEQIGGFLHDLRVLRSVRRGDYDAIQVRDKSFICVPAMITARRLGIPFFYWMSFPIAESLSLLANRLNPVRDFPRWLFLKVRGDLGGVLLRRFVLTRADHIFVQSDKMASDLAAIGLPRERMTAVPMCIDPDRFADPLPSQSSATSAKTIGYLGECSRVRRIDFLFEALRHVHQTAPDVELLVLGDAYEEADRQWLRQRMAETGVDERVTITGWLPADQIVERFAKVDLALALMAPDPILDSTTPTKLVEYLAMGLPVVANAHPDQCLVLGESGAGLVTPFTPVAYGDAILELLGDDSRRAEMALKGPAYVAEKRSYPRMAKSLAAAYKTLLGSRKAVS
jgi:glycosyltransferase involved in cell wall biosynthesis